MDESNLMQWMHEVADQNPYLDKESLLALIEKRVAELLQEQPDLLFSFLYRLDVDEYKIKQALQAESVTRALAVLIVDRQLARIKTKEANKKDDILYWE